MGKAELRRFLRRKRNAMSSDDQQAAARGLLVQLSAQPWFADCQKVALYIANDGEVDPVEVVRHCRENGQTCYLPVIMPGQSSLLQFAPYHAGTPLRPNRFGIPEPVADHQELIAGEELDLVLLPLVGFDLDGHRLGMGGGFYDTTFAFKHKAPNTPPKLVGLAHEVQRVDRIAVENWDVPISAVATDQRWHEVPLNHA